MTQVRFTRDVMAFEGGEFRMGDVIELQPQSIERWMRRGAIEIVTDTERIATKTVTSPKTNPKK